MARVLTNLLFHTLPEKPEHGKWTKLPPSNDWFMLLMNMGGLAETMMQCAFGHMEAISIQPDPNAVLSFAEKMGIQLHDARDLVSDQDRSCDSVKLVVVITNDPMGP